ncbi:putative reverse transcriptase domain-containing protein [Tanacetum coccineum]
MGGDLQLGCCRSVVDVFVDAYWDYQQHVQRKTLKHNWRRSMEPTNKCKKIGHLARDCRSSGPNVNNNNRGKFRITQNAVTCYECGVQEHFKKDCPKLKNGNRGNQRGNGNAPAKVYVVGNAGTNLDSNVVTGTFLLNDGYASILFDTGADGSFERVCQEQLQELSDKALYRHLFSPWAPPVLFVRKVRTIILDVQTTTGTLNKTKREESISSLPGIDDLFDQLQGSSVSSKIDLRSGYHQLRVREEDILKTPFRTRTRKNMKEHLKEILELFKKEELYAKFSKCKFWIPKVQFPGHVIDSQGLAGYYRRFIEGFSKIARAMTNHTHEESPMHGVTSKKQLSDIEETRRFHEKNYTTHDLELGAVVFALKIWRHYLYGTKCTVFTDHKSLQYILDQKELNMRHTSLICIKFLEDHLHKGFGTNLNDTAYPSQTEGTKRENKSKLSRDMLLPFVIDIGKYWLDIAQVKFSYNNIYHASIKACTFEAL